MARIGYRVRQFFRLLMASASPLTAADLTEAQMHLPAAAWPLFAAMSAADQQHSLGVARALRAAGRDHPALLQAALLHDCAKRADGVRIWRRVAMVLLRTFAPDTLARWTLLPAPSHGNWRYPLWAYVNHSMLGAELAAATGCEPLAIALIAQHQACGAVFAGDPFAQQLLAALQAADNDN
jgi:hypothetical protein